jgi:PEP-CTERM motif
MVQRLTQLFLLLALGACFCTVASADQIGVGLLSYDATTSNPTTGAATASAFDITNFTGPGGAFDTTDFPITTQLTFTVTSVVADLLGGGSVVIPGTSFTSGDTDGDLNCTGAGCNLFADSITSATLTGTLSPITGLGGLPAGDTGIDAAFTTVLTPSCGDTLSPGCDAAIIFATGTTGGVTPAPEPGTLGLFSIGIIGLFIGRKRLGLGSRRVSTAVA